MIQTTLFSSQSYWDRLPPDIEHYIHSLSTWQTILDLRKITPRKLLLEEILDYHKLKSDWGLGRIECTRTPCQDPDCPGKIDNIKKGLHLVVEGHYTNFDEHENFDEHTEFLGYGFKDALDRLPHVKSNLLLRWGGLIELAPPVETS